MSEIAYASGPSTVPLLGQTIGQNLRATAERHGDREALVVPFQDVRLTYAELVHEVERFARLLLAMGLRKGDRLGIWSPNCAEWVLVQYATAQVGVVLVNLNPAYRTSEVAYALRQSGCRAVMTMVRYKTSEYRDMLQEVRPELGFPKGATLTHHNILNNGYFIGEGCAYAAEDRVCIPVPFYHCFGMVLGNLACTTHGAAIVVPAPTFDPMATLHTVESERCTSLYGVPTMFIAELDRPDFDDYDLTSLRTGIMAGSPCPVEVMKQCTSRMHMREVTICYGMTETSPVSTQTAVDDPVDKRVGTVGRVHPHVEVKIVDPVTGRPVARGESGELCTRGYSVMLGYWDEPERTAEAIDAGRWMHTGDLATMDDDGYLNIVGRIKDMVIRGGENIYPREIEEFLYAHPDIVDVQVIGVPDDRYGEELMAWVRLREGATLTVDDVAAFCEGRIARHKIPRYVHVADEFPMTVTGKVQKYKMRETAIELLGLHGAASIDTA